MDVEIDHDVQVIAAWSLAIERPMSNEPGPQAPDAGVDRG
jgi:hypothetical protein